MSDNKRIDFESLYKRALGEWPNEIKFGPLIQHGDRREISRDLYLLCEKIIKPHLKSTEEVLMRSLHDAIYSVFSELAINCIGIKKTQIRKEAVRSDFEKRLGPDWIAEKYGWTDADRKLVQDYFIKTQKTATAKPKKAAKRKKA